jgi:DNA-binding CsgD family transcriptional regulator
MAFLPEEELSARELEVLARVVTGATNRQVAVELNISPNTVKVHVSNILAKLGAQSRAEATRIALERGLVSADATSSDGGSHMTGASALVLPPEVSWPLPPIAAWGMVAAVLAVLVLVLLPPWRRAGQSALSERLLDAPGGAAPTSETESTRWRTLLAMPTARARFAQTVVNDAIYVIGGQTAAGPGSMVEIYYPDVDLWGRGAAKPTPVANVAAVAVDGLIFVPGGLRSSGALSDELEIYNPRLDAWAQAARLPLPLCSYAVAGWEDGFFLFGGWDGARYVDTVLYYDTATDDWRQVGTLTQPRGFSAAAAVDGRIYVVGGYDGATELATCESFEPAPALAGELTWRRHADLGVGRAGHGLVAANGSLYVCGGGWAQPFEANERYDARLDAWSAFESPVTGEWRTLGLAAIDQTAGTFLYAIGGWSGDYRNTVYAYQAFYRVYIP